MAVNKPVTDRTRRAVAGDAPALADVWLRSRQASVPAIPPPAHGNGDVRDWFANVLIPERETWVIEDEHIVALLVLHEGWIDQLYVDPTHTGQGLGSRLVDLAKERRCQGLDLWTFQANLGARRFYERQGFALIAATDGDNEEHAPDVRYHWPAASGCV